MATVSAPNVFRTKASSKHRIYVCGAHVAKLIDFSDMFMQVSVEMLFANCAINCTNILDKHIFQLFTNRLNIPVFPNPL